MEKLISQPGYGALGGGPPLKRKFNVKLTSEISAVPSAFASQFFDPNSKEPATYISSPEFMKLIEARGKELGHSIGVSYGEGFTVDRNIGTRDLWDLI